MEEEAKASMRSQEARSFRRALRLTMRVIKCVLIFLLLVGEWGGPIPPKSLLDSAYTHLILTDRRNLLVCYESKWLFMWFGCWSRVIPILAICLGLRGKLRLGIVKCQIHLLRKYQAPLL